MDSAHDRPEFVTYKTVTAFVGHSFSRRDVAIVRCLKHLLAALGVVCDSGEKPNAGSISEKVTARIARNDTFIGIFTRQQQLGQSKEWTTSSWVIEEKAAAIQMDKQILLLIEEGVADIGGMHADHEYVTFKRNTLFDNLPKIVDYFSSLTLVSRSSNIDMARKNVYDSIGASLKKLEQNPSADRFIKTARQVRSERGDEESDKLLQKALHKFPESFDLKYERAKILRQLGKSNEARRLYEGLLDAQPDHWGVLHNFAHLLSDVGDLDGALEHFRKALDLKANVENFRCFGNLVYRNALSASETATRNRLLSKAKHLLESANDLADKTNKDVVGRIHRIDDLLAEGND